MIIKAIILFFSLSLFVTESVSLPVQFVISYKKMMAGKEEKKGKCCRKKENRDTPPNKCQNTDACVSCPCISLYINQASYAATVTCRTIQAKYLPFQNGDLSAYKAKKWRPPNDYLLYG